MNQPTPPSPQHPRARNVTVVLGPTNTGKTHLAVEQMISHDTGMIGLPLRLLAREVYDTVCRRCGPEHVALITGEEKIVPPAPRYYVCTVEAMPRDVKVDFLAIDEIQLAADFQRGHIFTDRLLHRRGDTETMILGAPTMRAVISQLLPGANFVSRPRFSRLTYAGQKKLTRLPARSAIVSFSADAVYATAELIRRQRGGAAVVLGALSPRTRNAQVELFQSGDVDFLVATDAIGMGLNMDVDHIAFAATRKFDGHRIRDLADDELAQIAGRAGRHMNDGTFGVTGEASPFTAETIERLETHSFEPVKVLQWRNRTLDYSSLTALADSLARAPDIKGLTRARVTDDAAALDFLSRDPDIARICEGSTERVHLLWDVCQVPDYRNITGGDHAALLGRIFAFLTANGNAIPADWFAHQVSFADNTDGDIDTLSTRIAHIRTWTFVANKPDWLSDPAQWQQRTRAIEDKLSDALHERLTQRFIDRRTSVLMKRMREKETLMSAVSNDGDITVEGQFVGQLKGFHFVPDAATDDAHGRALRSASLKAVASEVSARARRFAAVPDQALEVTLQAGIVWEGARIARLQAGDDALRPRVQLIADNQLSGDDRQLVQNRLDTWLAKQLETHLAPLLALAASEGLEGLSRGIAFQLLEGFGILVRDDVAGELKQLEQSARADLRRVGVRFGSVHVFVPLLLKPAATHWKLVLWALQREKDGALDLEQLPEPPQQGLTSVPADKDVPDGFYRSIGFRVCGSRAVRIDMLERVADLIRPLVFWKPEKADDVRPEGSVEGGGFTVVPDMMSLVGCSGDEFAGILRALGFRVDRRRVAASTDTSADEPETCAPAGADAVPEPKVSEGGQEPATAPPDDEGSQGAEEASEPQYLEVWRPRPKTPRQAKGREAGTARSERKAGGKQRRSDRKPKQKKPVQRTSAGPPPKPEDSPFAALAALQEGFKTNKSADS